MDVSTHLLRLFLAVARMGSFTRAAEQFYISQPAASAGIARLERQLGVRLFDRLAQGLRLTEAGEAFHLQAQQALAAFDRGVADARRKVLSPRITVVYQSPTIASSWIPPLLALWATLAPDMVVEEREVELGTWQESLRSGTAQLAVVHCAGDMEGFESYTIGSDDLVVVTSESVSDLLPPGPVDLRLLAGSRLLIWQRAQAPAYYDLVVGAFRDAGLDPVVDTRLRRATTRVAEIASGETVAVLPSQAAAFPQPGVRYRAIQGGPTASVDVVWQAAESRREVLVALDVVRLNVVDVA